MLTKQEIIDLKMHYVELKYFSYTKLKNKINAEGKEEALQAEFFFAKYVGQYRFICLSVRGLEATIFTQTGLYFDN